MDDSNIFSGPSYTRIWLLVCLFLTIWYMVTIFKPFNYWKKKGVKMARVLPVIGDIVLGFSMSKKPYPEMLREVYEEGKDARYVGYYECLTPILMIKSPDLLKQLFVKDANKFGKRRVVIPETFDKLISKNMFYLKGHEWKETRSFWNYFLTAIKVKKMYPLINETANTFVEKLTEEGKEIIEIDLRDTIAKYIAKFAASLYFGIQQGSSDDETEKFFQYASDGSPFDENSTWDLIRFCLTLTFPKVANFLGVQSILRKEVQSFFLEKLEKGIKRENENSHHRQDMIGFLVERQKEENNEDSEESIKKDRSKMNEIEITSQLCIFLLSSLDGLAATLRYAMYELAIHPDIQKKLREEFEESCSEGDHPSYNTIVNQTYLDMVISETMRKWPGVLLVDRVCTEPYKIEPVLPGEKALQLEVGDIIGAPMYPLHYDPEYFPNPDKFDPERFSQENRSKMHPFSYLPWGIGPKNCNGGKLSLLVMKISLFYLLKHFELVPTNKTPIPIVLKATDIKLIPEGGIVLGLRKRKIP